jgi:hypothetical protein
VFGSAVDLCENVALIGAIGAEGVAFFTGAAYLMDVTTGETLHRLEAPDGVYADFFGTAVSIDGNRAVVGAGWHDADPAKDDDTGIAYLYDVATGRLVHKLFAPDGAPQDVFGRTVGVAGAFVLVGAPGDDDGGFMNSGSVYVFDSATGHFLVKRTAPDPTLTAHYGISIDFRGTTAVIGADHDGGSGYTYGSVYVIDVVTGQQIWKLRPSDGAPSDLFGASVAFLGDTIVVGSRLDDDAGTSSGSVYFFDLSTGTELGKVVPADATPDQLFGYAVGISEAGVVAAAVGDADGGMDAGAVYVLDERAYAVAAPESSPAVGMSVAPNPFRSAVRVTFASVGSTRPGVHVVTWDGLTDSGRRVPAGVYFLRRESDDGIQVRKVVRVR